MNTSQTCIGIDVSKPFLDCYATPDGKSKRFTNSPEGIKACLTWICKYNRLHRIVLEPTGGYEKPIIHALHKAALPIACVNARFIHHFAVAKQDRAKTDALDAQTIAEYGQAMSPRLTKPRAACLETLAALVARRKVAQNMLLAETTRLHQTTQEQVIQSLQASLAFLKQSLQLLTMHINTLLQDDSLQETVTLLLQTKGIGSLSAASIVAFLPEIGHISGKEIARLVGVAPLNNDSGKRSGVKSIRGGGEPPCDELCIWQPLLLYDETPR